VTMPTPEELYRLWRLARVALTKLKPTGQWMQGDGIELMFADLSWAMMNAAFFTRAARDEEDAVRRLSFAQDWFKARKSAWTLNLWEQWLTPPVLSALRRLGFRRTATNRGMAAERLVPGRPPPVELELRQVQDRVGRLHLMEVNAACYNIPREWAVELASLERFFAPTDFVYVGYVNDTPVSTGTSLRVGDIHYIAWVATHPEYRKRGYGEAVMRKAYGEAVRAFGFERTALYSTDAGFSMYQTMGYQAVTGMAMFVGSGRDDTPTSR